MSGLLRCAERNPINSIYYQTMFRSMIIVSALCIVFSLVKIKCAVPSPEYEMDRYPMMSPELVEPYDDAYRYYLPSPRDSLVRRLMKRKYYISQRLG
ncbi:unnamed protein product [Schistosoma turkestanicum]|nr:unnamed protein product [Schistosoma turkestanicum]